MNHQNYFSWRDAVAKQAVQQGISEESIAAQDPEAFQQQYFEQMLSVDEAVEQLKDVVIPIE